MKAFRRIKNWWERLSEKPADLFELLSGSTTLVAAIVAWVNTSMGREISAISWLSGAVSPEVFFSVAILASIAQLWALRYYDRAQEWEAPGILCWQNWFRALPACVLGIWYLIFMLAMIAQIGVYHTQIYYLAFVCSNAFAVRHVLTRP